MRESSRHSVLFAIMAVLVFIVIQVFSFNEVSSGPNIDVSLGWLELHRRDEAWTIERFHFVGLVVVLLISFALTWIYSMIRRRQML